MLSRRWAWLAWLLLWLWSRPAFAATHAFELVEVESVPTMARGETHFVAVELRNLSERVWRPSDRIRLAYHWRRLGDETPLVFDGVRTELRDEVAPGETVRLQARVDVPDVEGPLELEWAMVHESVRWFPRPQSGADPLSEVRLVPPAPRWTALELEAPETWAAETKASIRVRLRNEGPQAWDPRHRDRVALRWYREDRSALDLDGSRCELPARVEPGEAVELRCTARAPAAQGVARLGFEPLREGARWYGPSANPEDGAGWRRVELLPHPLQWSLTLDSPTGAVPASESLRVPVTLRNEGREAWGEGDRLSYRWLDAEGVALEEGPRTRLGGAVEPGESVMVRARVRAPDHPGLHRLRFEMVREGERWYGPPRSGAPELKLEVAEPRLDWALVEAEAVSWGWTNTRTQVRVVLENRGTETWDPAAGDRLAYHWRDVEGALVEFEGVRSHFDAPVPAGARVELEATVEYPREPGKYRVEWEMVREHERWLGPSPVAEQTTRVFRKRVGFQLMLIFSTLGAGLLWSRRPRRGTRLELLYEALPLGWTALVLGSLAVMYSELAHLGFWRGARPLVWSGAALLAAVPAFFLGRRRAQVALVWVSLASVATLVDLVYMEFFGSIVPLSALGHAGHLWEVLDSAVAGLAVEQLWLFAMPLCGLLLALWRGFEMPRIEVWGGWRRAVAVTACLGLGSPAMAALNETMRGTIGARVFSEQDNVGRMGLFNAHLFELARGFREARERRELDAEGREALRAAFEVRAEVAKVAAASEPAASWAGVASGENLLVVQVEALQQWVIGLEIEGAEVTPFLNRWHERGLSFRRVVDQTAQGKTADAEYLLLNSQHPLEHGSTAFLRASNDFWTVAHLLKGAGYATFSAHPYRRGFWNRAVLHPRYGFEESWFRRELGPGPQTGWGLADGPFFERVAAHLAKLEQPWFAFLITLSLHHPYDAFPAALATLEVGGLQGTPLGNYLQAMNYFDRSLASLMGALDASGLADDTVVALFGDHDARFELHRSPELLELIGEKGWSPGLPARMDFVPFFVRVPGDAAPRGWVDTLGGQIDMGPTLLHLLGLPRPDSFVGRVLAPGVPARIVAHPTGAAYGEGKFFVPRGREIPPGGACFGWPEGERLELEDCGSLGEEGRALLDESRSSLDANLARWLAGAPVP